ncbi:MAG: hypothetical protein MZW92_51340 [Comamonadaceae bacterium]|nr:hypothetical protein [Comamonadaceae bacterium]
MAQMTDLRAQGAQGRASTCAWSRTRWCAVRSAARRSQCLTDHLKSVRWRSLAGKDPVAAAKVVRGLRQGQRQASTIMAGSMGGKLMSAARDEGPGQPAQPRSAAGASCMGTMQAPVHEVRRDPQRGPGEVRARAWPPSATRSRPPPEPTPELNIHVYNRIQEIRPWPH